MMQWLRFNRLIALKPLCATNRNEHWRQTEYPEYIGLGESVPDIIFTFLVNGVQKVA